MRKPWRLTKHAEQSLLEIALWTVEKFGPLQAEKYEEELIDRCDAISAGTAFVQNCGILLGDPTSTNLKLARAGQHFIIFEEMSEMIVILYFIHSRSDLPGKISYLGGLHRTI
jgi:toxin ParE1/3/4